MGELAVLVVDMQKALVDAKPFNHLGVVANIKKLITTARQEKVEVVYVQHDGGAGDDLEKGTKGWEICEELAPAGTEKVFDKHFNSAFKETDLQEYLHGKGIQSIILVGMQTEYCIDTSCKVALEFGYRLTMPEGTTTTFDNDYFTGEQLVRYYEQKIWKHRFAEVIPLEDVLGRLGR